MSLIRMLFCSQLLYYYREKVQIQMKCIILGTQKGQSYFNYHENVDCGIHMNLINILTGLSWCHLELIPLVCLSQAVLGRLSSTIQYKLYKNSKWVWSGNIKITNRRQPRGTARKSRSTITRHQEDKSSKATSSFFPIKMIAILEWT